VIPNYQKLMRPFLEFAKDGEVRLKDVKEHIAKVFNLSEQERAELLPSGKQTVLDNRVGWTRTYIKSFAFRT